jgi:hypothetical protein
MDWLMALVCKAFSRKKSRSSWIYSITLSVSPHRGVSYAFEEREEDGYCEFRVGRGAFILDTCALVLEKCAEDFGSDRVHGI